LGLSLVESSIRSLHFVHILFTPCLLWSFTVPD
jgi:hypothetical protein